MKYPFDKESIVNYILSLERENGSWAGDIWGEEDTRFVYCALSGLSLLGCLDRIKGLDKVLNYIQDCSNFDGGYGSMPGSESHAGQGIKKLFSIYF